MKITCGHAPWNTYVHSRKTPATCKKQEQCVDESEKKYNKNKFTMKNNKNLIASAIIMTVATMGVSCKSVKRLGTVGTVNYYRVSARTFDGPNITALVEQTGGKIVTKSGAVVPSCTPSKSTIVATASGPGIGHAVIAAVGGVGEALIMKDAFRTTTNISNALSSASNSSSRSKSNSTASNTNRNEAKGGAGGAGGRGGAGGAGGAGGRGGNGGSATSTSSGGGNGGGNGNNGHGNGNNGHGNNNDGVDVSNPGGGNGGPNGQDDQSGNVDDEN